MATFDRMNQTAFLHCTSQSLLNLLNFLKKKSFHKKKKSFHGKKKRAASSCFVFNLQGGGWGLNDRVMAKLGRKLHLCLPLSFCLIPTYVLKVPLAFNLKEIKQVCASHFRTARYSAEKFYISKSVPTKCKQMCPKRVSQNLSSTRPPPDHKEKSI